MNIKKLLLILLVITIPKFVFCKDKETSNNECLNYNILSSLIGGLCGGVLGVFGTIMTSYYGPKKLIEFNLNIQEQKLNGPRKELLKKLLNDPKYPKGRTISTLSMVTGMTYEECRRLLVEINARGIKLKGGIEGWGLIEKNPINEE